MRILFITHAVDRSGAPKVLITFLRWIKKNYPSTKVDIISLETGVLENEFRAVSTSYWKLQSKKIPGVLNRVYSKLYGVFFSKWLKIRLNNHNYDLIYANTVLSLPVASEFLKRNMDRTKLILHLHELDSTIQYYLKDFARYIPLVNHYIAVSDLVKKNLVEKYNVDPESISIIYPPVIINKHLHEKANFLKKDYFEVGASGVVHWKKGDDVFIQVARILKKYHPELNIKFTWVGEIEGQYSNKIIADIEKLGLTGMVSFIGGQSNPHYHFKRFDLLLLTSREESFSLVSAEAGLLGKPIICFDKSIGVSKIIENGGGFVVPYLDVEAMAEKIIFYYNNRDILKKDGEKNRKNFSVLDPNTILPELFNVIKKVTRKE